MPKTKNLEGDKTYLVVKWVSSLVGFVYARLNQGGKWLEGREKNAFRTQQNATIVVSAGRLEACLEDKFVEIGRYGSLVVFHVQLCISFCQS